MPETAQGSSHVPAGGLGSCHLCSESGPEAGLGLSNPQTQFQAVGHTGSPAREARDCPQAPGPALTGLCRVSLQSQLAHTLSLAF